jgi:hypothetical protein
MRIHKFGVAALALVSGISLGGCAYDTYGPGGYGYGPYSSLSVGVGYGGGYGYGDPYYGGYSPFGWYDDFYYPGTGVYVYDSYRRPRMWNDHERAYWEQRRGSWHDRDGDRDSWRNHNARTWSNNDARVSRPNWSGFDHRSGDRRHHQEP